MAAAHGFANRVGAVPNTVETRFGIASGAKGLTVLAVMSLIERGELTLDTSARSVLGADLPHAQLSATTVSNSTVVRGRSPDCSTNT